ncbi:PE family protein [Mycolicibacterium parafortuitum]|uniref:PE family immunomodulator PE35 n=1 Tax=Mycolicibacterium parafortuitum TaxID=39692 RepID=A0A375YDV6_MYCPF|nr:PE family protein [Mycolicibacterium parafortuitum]ORB31241.1 PE family protein [Mycolicibacterium parafortuitum]SRX79291.1 PE family immunomodulator PE35 [Mycolicibacterium parafortuitum]
MQPLAHNPAAAGIGGQVTANGARGLGFGTAATAEVSALAPAGVDEISATAALSFASEGVQTLGINALAQQEIARAGAAVIESSVAYEATDVAIGTTLI